MTLTRRAWLRTAAASLAVPAALRADDKKAGFTLPPLPYPTDALEVAIDKQTMEIHHGRHHKTYIDNLNKALAGTPELLAKPIEELVRDWDKLPPAIKFAVRNNGGGHYNHSLFWQVMGPTSGAPSGKLADAIASIFKDVATLQKTMKDFALTQFGSGWSWLVVNDQKKLAVVKTPNQDSPLSNGRTPILGVDVWEHAYYLRYQNKRADYIDAWFKVVNWAKVGELFEKAVA